MADREIPGGFLFIPAKYRMLYLERRGRQTAPDGPGSMTTTRGDSLIYLPSGKTCEYEIMYEKIFSVLMVIGLGVLAGGVLGLLIGFALGKQRPAWSEMTLAEKRLNGILVIVSSVIASVGLGWYSLLR